MTKPMSAAQTAQQHNRDDGGRYATKEQAEAPVSQLDDGTAWMAKMKPFFDELAEIEEQQTQLRMRKVQVMAQLVAMEIHPAHPEAAWAVLER